MMNRKKIFSLISLVCDAFVLAVITKIVVTFFLPPSASNPSLYGTASFTFFTVDSNILAALACLAMIPYHIMILSGKKADLPLAVRLLKYASVSAVTLTFLTVILFLGPTQGFETMYTGNNFWMHLICPLINIFTFLISECEGKLRFRYSLYSIIPMLIYTVVYLIEVVILGPENGGWYDIYGFNMGGLWYVFAPVMIAAAYGIGAGMLVLHNLFAKLSISGRKAES